MKKIFLLGAFALGALVANAAAVEIDGIQYNLNAADNTASVTGPGMGDMFFYSGDIEIPETVTYDGVDYTVTSVGAGAFYMQMGVSSITCPNSVTVLDGSALSSPRVTDIILGNNIQQIGNLESSAFPTGTSFSRLTIMTPTPPELLINQITNTVRAHVVLTVPESSLELYKAAWEGFQEYIGVPTGDNVPAESVTLSESAITLSEDGETYTLTYEVTPADTTDEAVWWSSSDEAVATVADGIVTAVANGSAVITLTVGEVSATCNVTVSINSGVAEIAIDGASVRYYNMQGIEIVNPAKSQPVIIRQGDKSFKVVM